MGFRLFKKKKKKKTSGDDNSQYTYESASKPQEDRSRYELPPMRQLKSSSERMRKARKAKQLQQQKDPVLSQTPPAGNWLTRTKFFSEMCDSAFQLIDADGSGEVDEKELYSGLLLIHLKLGTYAGPAACRPLSRERCHAVFLKFDKDNSGYLDRDEFGNVMGVLFGNVLSRVVLQYCMTLTIVPFLANVVVSGTVMGASKTWTFISELDEHSTLANQTEVLVEMMRQMLVDLYRATTPMMIQNGNETFMALLGKVPQSVWLSLPLTLTSAILGLLIVPRSIMWMDDLFQQLADRKSKRV